MSSKHSSHPIVIAAGGTGGHLFPAQALASELKRRGRRLILITDNRGEGFAQDFAGAEIAHIRAATFAGAGLMGRAKAALKIFLGIFDAYQVLRREKPRVVIGFGGYPSFPTMVAAMLYGVRRCVHEQNAILGRVNRAIATRINVIASTFGEFDDVPASINKKVVLTGNPLRDPVITLAGAPYQNASDGSDVNLLVFGGSQGARIFSDTLPQAIELLPATLKSRLSVVQQCRPEDEERVAAAYRDAGVRCEVSSFFTDMARRMVDAHLIICRSGASTVCEISAIGRPAIFVPLPTAMDDHQTVNASYLSRVGGAWIMPQSDFSAASLATKVTDLFMTPDLLEEAADKAKAIGRLGATSKLADLLEDVEAKRSPRVSDPTNESTSKDDQLGQAKC